MSGAADLRGAAGRAPGVPAEAGAGRACPAWFISAPGSGHGKTTLTAALARFHAREGRVVRVFKCGPDFLDPMMLERASGQPVYQLDLWMAGAAHCRQLVYEAACSADLILIEGVMGLFDGAPSSADLAVLLGVPVLAVLDARGTAQTLGALAHGLATYRPDLTVAGVLANSVASARHEEMIRAGMPAGLPYLGSLPRSTHTALPERHLGLVQAQEVADLDARLTAAADLIAATRLVQLPARVTFLPGDADHDSDASPDTPDTPDVPDVPDGDNGDNGDNLSGPPDAGATPTVSTHPAKPSRAACGPAHAAPPPHRHSVPLAGVRIGVARDAAFSFIYRANLELLCRLGAQLRFFSPLADAALPEIDSLYLPGGYPELHLPQLAANTALKQALHRHAGAGKPLFAECGGLLYLLESLTDRAGQRGAMAGLLPGHAVMSERLQGLGYQSAALPGGVLRGHTFHHSRIDTPLAPDALGTRLHNTSPGERIFRSARLIASYIHLYFPSNPAAAADLFKP